MPVTQQHQPIGWRNELSALLRLAVPLMATQLVQVLMVFTDTLMMGLLGPAALAGGGLGAASYSFISISCVGVSVAAGSLVAMRLGAGDQRGVRQVTQAGLWLALVMGLLAGLLLSMLAPLLLGLGQQAHNVAAAMQYLQALRFALPGYLLFTVLRGYSAALGKPGPVLAITLCGSLANIALNYALLHGLAGLPRLGLFGIGLATALVMNGMALLMALYIAWQPFYRRYALLRGILRPGWAALRANLRLGLPIGAIYALESLLFVVAALCMGALGDLQLAAHQIAVQTVYVAFMLPTGIAYACTFRIGLHQGAGQLHLARLSGRLGLALGALCMLGIALLFWLAPAWLVGLYIDRHATQHAALLSQAVTLLAIAAWFELFDGLQTIAMGCLRGLGEGRSTLLIGLLGYLGLGAPLAWYLAFSTPWGASGVWWGMAAGLAGTALGLVLAFERRLRPARSHRQKTDFYSEKSLKG